MALCGSTRSRFFAYSQDRASDQDCAQPQEVAGEVTLKRQKWELQAQPYGQCEVLQYDVSVRGTSEGFLEASSRMILTKLVHRTKFSRINGILPNLA